MSQTFIFLIKLLGAPSAPHFVMPYEVRKSLNGNPVADGNISGKCEGEKWDVIQGLCARVQSSLVTKADVEELGELLFTFFFTGSLKSTFLKYCAETQRDKNPPQLRVELNIDAKALPEVVNLPWELLKAPMEELGCLLLFGIAVKITLSRKSLCPDAEEFLPKNGDRARLLMLVSQPSDLPKVRYESVYREIQRFAPGNLELLEPAVNKQLSEIDELLKKTRPDIVHFIGHAEKGSREGRVALVDAVGLTAWTPATEFAEVFTRQRPALVVLQACESAAGASSQTPFSSVAAQLIQQKIPMAVAMQYAISNAAACTFAKKFYQQLLEEESSVDVAVQEARRELKNLQLRDEIRAYATPVLYRSVDGRLWLERSNPIDKLTHCKKMHDAFQALESALKMVCNMYLMTMLRDRKELEEEDWKSLRGYALELAKKVRGLESEFKKELWSGEFRKVLRLIIKAIRLKDTSALGKSCAIMHREVSQRTFQLNTALVHLVKSDPALRENLEDFIDAHDLMQTIDNDFKMLPAGFHLKFDPLKFQSAWDIISPKLTALGTMAGDRPEVRRLTREFSQRNIEVSQALKGEDRRVSADKVMFLMSALNQNFNRLDFDLLRECERLQGEPP